MVPIRPTRIFAKKNNSDDEPEFLLSPCFDIGPDVQLKEIPTTGEEYLLKVITERKKCAVITKCDEDYSKFAKNQSRFIEMLPDMPSTPDNLKPTVEWQNMQVADFSEIRMYISRVRSNTSLWPSNVKTMGSNCENFRGWRKIFKTMEPTLSYMLGIVPNMLDRGLEFLIEELQAVNPGHSIDDKTGRWIYSFLACLNQPLLSDTVCILRDLARKCAEIRSRLNPEDDNAIIAATPMNIFICIVARYFRQWDLAD